MRNTEAKMVGQTFLSDLEEAGMLVLPTYGLLTI